MANNVSGKVVNEIQFKINKKSWDNLTQFQNKITNIKRQLSGLKGSMKVHAVVSNINKVTEAASRGARKVQDAHVKAFESSMKARGKAEAQISYKTAGAQLAFQRRQIGLDGRGSAELGIGRQNAMSMITKYNQQLREGSLTVREYNQRVNHAVQQNMRLARSNTKTGTSFRDLRTELVQMTAAYTAFSAGVNIFNTGRKIEGLEAGMKVFSGSDANVIANMTWVEETSRKLGANFLSMAENYTKFSIVARNKLTQDEIKTLFQSVTEYATVMQTDQQQFDRSMKALNQIDGLALQ